MKNKTSNKVIYLLSLIGFFGIFSTTISKDPVLPLFVTSLGGSATVLGIIAAFSPLAGMLCSFPVGLLSDRWGRKKLLLISGIIFSLAPLLYLLVGNVWLLIPIRFFHGLATAILGPLAAAMIVSAYDSNKGEKLGWYASATLFGRMLAPLLGGLILSNWVLDGISSYKTVYFTAFVISLPVLFFILWLEKNDRLDRGAVQAKHPLALSRGLKIFVQNQRLLSTSVIQLAAYFSFGVLETYLPIYLAGLHISATKIGLIFSVQVLALMISQPLFGRLADRLDQRWQIMAGMILIGLIMALIPTFSSYRIIMILSLIFGFGISMTSIAVNAYVADIAAKEVLGASMGALDSLMDVGQTFGPLLVGLMITAWSMRVGFAACLVLSIVAITFFFLANDHAYSADRGAVKFK